MRQAKRLFRDHPPTNHHTSRGQGRTKGNSRVKVWGSGLLPNPGLCPQSALAFQRAERTAQDRPVSQDLGGEPSPHWTCLKQILGRERGRSG